MPAGCKRGSVVERCAFQLGEPRQEPAHEHVLHNGRLVRRHVYGYAFGMLVENKDTFGDFNPPSTVCPAEPHPEPARPTEAVFVFLRRSIAAQQNVHTRSHFRTRRIGPKPFKGDRGAQFDAAKVICERHSQWCFRNWCGNVKGLAIPQSELSKLGVCHPQTAGLDWIADPSAKCLMLTFRTIIGYQGLLPECELSSGSAFATTRVPAI